MKKFIQKIHFLACLLILAACASPTTNEELPRLFQVALMSERIQMRAGYTHTTQAFEIKDAKQVWEANLGFERKDDVLEVNRFFCLVISRLDPLRGIRKCNESEPTIRIKWALINSNDAVMGMLEYDARSRDANTQSGGGAYLLGLGAITNQPPGQYRIRLTVLSDVPELDVTKPRIVIALPFFRR